jgi:hypothetical protein
MDVEALSRALAGLGLCDEDRLIQFYDNVSGPLSFYDDGAVMALAEIIAAGAGADEIAVMPGAAAAAPLLSQDALQAFVDNTLRWLARWPAADLDALEAALCRGGKKSPWEDNGYEADDEGRMDGRP